MFYFSLNPDEFFRTSSQRLAEIPPWCHNEMMDIEQLKASGKLGAKLRKQGSVPCDCGCGVLVYGRITGYPGRYASGACRTRAYRARKREKGGSNDAE